MADSELEPVYLENGKYVCPVCLKRDNLTIVDYGLQNGLYSFDVKCKKCNVIFRVLKKM